jgi:hypothetical protein
MAVDTADVVRETIYHSQPVTSVCPSPSASFPVWDCFPRTAAEKTTFRVSQFDHGVERGKVAVSHISRVFCVSFDCSRHSLCEADNVLTINGLLHPAYADLNVDSQQSLLEVARRVLVDSYLHRLFWNTAVQPVWLSDGLRHELRQWCRDRNLHNPEPQADFGLDQHYGARTENYALGYRVFTQPELAFDHSY